MYYALQNFVPTQMYRKCPCFLALMFFNIRVHFCLFLDRISVYAWPAFKRYFF